MCLNVLSIYLYLDNSMKREKKKEGKQEKGKGKKKTRGEAKLAGGWELRVWKNKIFFAIADIQIYGSAILHQN